jgi:hypothetical protein
VGVTELCKPDGRTAFFRLAFARGITSQRSWRPRWVSRRQRSTAGFSARVSPRQSGTWHMLGWCGRRTWASRWQ